MPTGGASRRIGTSVDGWKSTPVRFPSGASNIVAVKECDNEYGPYMIKTDAIGRVDVYRDDGTFYGKEYDTGYAIHSNVKDFSTSRSWGCVIVRQRDNERLARTLIVDRKQNSNSIQHIWVE
jgi:hypothetical protein